MRSVILKGTEIACINYFFLSGQIFDISYEILKLFCDYRGESSQILGGKGSLWLHGAALTSPCVRGAAADSRLGTWHDPTRPLVDHRPYFLPLKPSSSGSTT